MNQKHQPLNDLERFELVQAMYPEKLGENADMGDELDVIEEELGIDPDAFDDLVGRLVMLAPVMQSPLSSTIHHVLGEVIVNGSNMHMTAMVKREAQSIAAQ